MIIKFSCVTGETINGIPWSNRCVVHDVHPVPSKGIVIITYKNGKTIDVPMRHIQLLQEVIYRKKKAYYYDKINVPSAWSTVPDNEVEEYDELQLLTLEELEELEEMEKEDAKKNIPGKNSEATIKSGFNETKRGDIVTPAGSK